MRDTLFRISGIVFFVSVWWLLSLYLKSQPQYAAFHNFGPAETLASLVGLITDGLFWSPVMASLSRVFWGLLWAALIGIPLGLLFGYAKIFRVLTDIPFQFLRMVSPLAWMPIAVLFFTSWEGAIVFLIAMATLWPILFATASGVTKIDPDWLLLARNLGANDIKILRYIIWPAVLPDILTGLRLAVGVAWIVIVPAEFLGVTSGLGYAINDARDTIDYGRLLAWVLVVGCIGYLLDRLLNLLVKRYSWHAAEKSPRNTVTRSVWAKALSWRRQKQQITEQDFQI